MKKWFAVLSVLALLVFAGAAQAGSDPVYTGFFSDKAVSGYDTVAYFTEGKPVVGDKAFSYEYQGAVWLFSSAANRALFVEKPLQYAPQYGGYCAWAASQNKIASADPLRWKIVDGKLYLNYDEKIQQKWEADIPGFIAGADKNWPALLDK